MRKGVDGRLHVLAVLEEVAGCEGLHREGEVHDLCRMAIPCCKVHEAAFSHEEDGLAVWQDIAFDVFAGFVVRDGDAFQILAADFAVEVASIRTDGAVLHREEMRLGDDVDVAGDGEENVTVLSSFCHRHDFESIHHGFDGFDGIDFCHDDMGAEAFRTHRTAFAAPAITGDDSGLAGDGEIRAADDAVPGGLAGAVAVIKKVLAVGIIDCDHREFQLVFLFKDLQAIYACGGFFRAADEVLLALFSGGMEQVYEVAAVVDDDVGHVVEGLVQEHEIFLFGAGMPCIDGDAALDEAGCDRILRGERIAAGADDIRTRCFQRERKVGGLRFEMDGHDDGLAFEDLLFDEFFTQCIQCGHEFFDPGNTLQAFVGQGNITNHGFRHERLLSNRK